MHKPRATKTVMLTGSEQLRGDFHAASFGGEGEGLRPSHEGVSAHLLAARGGTDRGGGRGGGGGAGRQNGWMRTAGHGAPGKYRGAGRARPPTARGQ